jgi:hypothetical protein
LRHNGAGYQHREQEKTRTVTADDTTPYASEGVFLFFFSNNTLQYLATAILAGKRR